MATVGTVDLSASDVMATIEFYRRFGVGAQEKVGQGARYAVVDDPDGIHAGVVSSSDHPYTWAARRGETSGWPRRRV